MRVGRHPFGIGRLFGAYLVVCFPTEGALTLFFTSLPFLHHLPTFKEAESK